MLEKRIVIKREKQLKNLKSSKISCMNNTKWREFAELVDFYKFKGMKIKFLLDEKVFDFYNFGVIEQSYCDCMNGAFYYKEIEWVFIPKVFEKTKFNRDEKLKSIYEENNIDDLVENLNREGEFLYHIDSKGFTIYGYK